MRFVARALSDPTNLQITLLAVSSRSFYNDYFARDYIDDMYAYDSLAIQFLQCETLWSYMGRCYFEDWLEFLINDILQGKTEKFRGEIDIL